MLLLALLAVGVCGPLDSRTQCDAVVDLFLSVGLERFIDASPVCEWPGIACVGGDAVTGIDLSASNCSGTLPATLGSLLRLRSLSLSSNALAGTLPPSFYDLRALRSVQLQYNRLSGTLAPEFALLHSLSIVRLDHNAISGTVPPLLDRMHELRSLDLGHNRFRGQLPLALPHSIQALSFWGNTFSGVLPNSWRGSIDQLRFLDFSTNALSGSIPPAVLEAPLLDTLLGYSNSLTSIDPGLGCGAPRSLITCDLHENALVCSRDVPPCARRACRASTLCLVAERRRAPRWRIAAH